MSNEIKLTTNITVEGNLKETVTFTTLQELADYIRNNAPELGHRIRLNGVPVDGEDDLGNAVDTGDKEAELEFMPEKEGN